jgi:hypothetical protein
MPSLVEVDREPIALVAAQPLEPGESPEDRCGPALLWQRHVNPFFGPGERRSRPSVGHTLLSRRRCVRQGGKDGGSGGSAALDPSLAPDRIPLLVDRPEVVGRLSYRLVDGGTDNAVLAMPTTDLPDDPRDDSSEGGRPWGVTAVGPTRALGRRRRAG